MRSRLLIALVAALAISGCTWVKPPVYCYQVTAATVHSVDLGMNVAGDLYRAGKITDVQKDRIVKVHDVYRPSAQAAVAGCKAVGSQGDADKIVANLKVAADKVLEALVAGGVIK